MTRRTPLFSESSNLRKHLMKTIIDEEIAPSTNAYDWGLSRAAAFVGLATETKSDDVNQSYDDKPFFLRKRTGIEAICIWLNVPMPTQPSAT